MRSVRTVLVVAIAALATCLVAATAQAQTITTITGTAGGPNGAHDSWNNPANWDNGIPVGDMNAVVAPGVTAQCWNDATPSYSGTLTLENNSVLQIGWTTSYPNSINALGGAGIIMNDGSQLRLRMPAPSPLDLPPLTLQGDASIHLSPSTSAHHRTRNINNPITGTGALTVIGNNNNTLNLNVGNAGWSGDFIANADDGWRVVANTTGAFGTGDVYINDRPAHDRGVTLIIDAPDVIADTASLYLTGPKDNRQPAKLILNANETVSSFWVDGLPQPAGVYSAASGLTDPLGNPLIGGSGLLTVVGTGGPTLPPLTLTATGRSSGGSTWHFSSDPLFYDDPGGLATPITLGGGTQTASVTLPGEILDDPFYVVVEANDTGSPPSFAGALVAPQGYVFDADNDGTQDPGETQFYSTEGFPYASDRPQWTAGGTLAGWRYLKQPAAEVGPAGDPFPADTEAIWYGQGGGTVYLGAVVPQLIQGEWAPPTVQGTPETSITTDSGITARVVRTPNASGHYATSESAIPQLDIGNSQGSYPGSVAMLAPDHKSSGADGDDTAARFTAYVYIDPAWDTDPGPGFSYARTFAVSSDDGFRLKVGDSVVLEYEGTRGMPGTPDLAQVNFPAPGYWPIELDWFNGGSLSGVELSSREGAWWDPADWNSTDFKLLGDPSDNLQVYQRPVPDTSLSGNGLIGWYHTRSGDDFGALQGTRNDLTTGTGSPAETEFYFPDNYAYGPWGNLENDFKVRWVGTINIPEDGDYNFNFRMDTDDRSAIFIDVDGDGVVDPAPGTNWAWTVNWNNVHLTAGPHKVEFWALEYGGGEWSRLQWQKPGDPGLSTVPADVFTWEYTTGIGANTPGGAAIPGAIPDGQTSGDGALVQAALNVPGGIGSTTAAIRYFERYPSGGTTESRTRINITDNGNPGTFGGDDDYPGAVPGQNYDNIAFRARALFYSPGNETYAFAVASDDSYRIDINGKTFGWYNGGRAQIGTDSNFVYVTFPEAGFYKFALYHHEGGADAGIEFSHKATGNLLVSSPDPQVEGFTTDLANRFYTFQTHASMRCVGTNLVGTAFVHIPALGMDIAPDYWAVEQLPEDQRGLPGLLAEYYDFSGTYGWDDAHKVGERTVLTSGDFNFGDNYAYGPWGNLENNFGVRFTGFLDVPVTGTYRFHMETDDRSWIFIDLDGDGIPDPAPGNDNWHVWWDVYLAAGLHAVEFRSREISGGEWTRLSWMIPGSNTWQYIPAQHFSDIGNEGLFRRFAVDPGKQYTLRLVVDFFGDHLVIGPETFVFVPEPTTCLLLGGAILTLVHRRRRRK